MALSNPSSSCILPPPHMVFFRELKLNRSPRRISQPQMTLKSLAA